MVSQKEHGNKKYQKLSLCAKIDYFRDKKKMLKFEQERLNRVVFKVLWDIVYTCAKEVAPARLCPTILDLCNH